MMRKFIPSRALAMFLIIAMAVDPLTVRVFSAGPASAAVGVSRFSDQAMNLAPLWWAWVPSSVFRLIHRLRRSLAILRPPSTLIPPLDITLRWTVPSPLVQAARWPLEPEALIQGDSPIPPAKLAALEERLQLYQSLRADPRQEDVVQSVQALSILMRPLQQGAVISQGSDFAPNIVVHKKTGESLEMYLGLPEAALENDVSPYAAVFLLRHAQDIANQTTYSRTIARDAEFMRSLEAILRDEPHAFSQFKRDLDRVLSAFPSKRGYLDLLTALVAAPSLLERQRLIDQHAAQLLRRGEERSRWAWTLNPPVYNILADEMRDDPQALQRIVVQALLGRSPDPDAIERLYTDPAGGLNFRQIQQKQIDLLGESIRNDAVHQTARLEEWLRTLAAVHAMWAQLNPQFVRDAASEREPFLRELADALQSIILSIDPARERMILGNRALDIARANLRDVLIHSREELLFKHLETAVSTFGPNKVAELLFQASQRRPKLADHCRRLASRFEGVPQALTRLSADDAHHQDMLDWLDELETFAYSEEARARPSQTTAVLPGRPVTDRRITLREDMELRELVSTVISAPKGSVLPGGMRLSLFQLGIAQGMSRWFFIADPWSLAGGLICPLASDQPQAFLKIILEAGSGGSPRDQQRAAYLALWGDLLNIHYWTHAGKMDPVREYYKGLIDPGRICGMDRSFASHWEKLDTRERNRCIHDVQVAAVTREIVRWSKFPDFDDASTREMSDDLSRFPGETFHNTLTTLVPDLLNSPDTKLAGWEIEQAYGKLMDMLQQHAALGADSHPRAQPLRMAALEAIPLLKAAIQNNAHYPSIDKGGSGYLRQLVVNRPGGELYEYEQAEKALFQNAKDHPVIVGPEDMPNTVFDEQGNPKPGLDSLGLNFELSDDVKGQVIARQAEYIAEVAKIDSELAARLIPLPKDSLHGNIKVDQWHVKGEDLERRTAHLRSQAEDIASYSSGLDATLGAENFFGYTLGLVVNPATDMDLQAWKQLQWATGRDDRFPVYFIHISSLLIPTLRDPDGDTKKLWRAAQVVRERHAAQKRLPVPIRDLQINFAPSYAEFKPQGDPIPLLVRDQWEARRKIGAKTLAKAMGLSPSALERLEIQVGLSVVRSTFPEFYLSSGGALLVAIAAKKIDALEAARRMKGGSLRVRENFLETRSGAVPYLMVEGADPEPSVVMMEALLAAIRALGPEFVELRHHGAYLLERQLNIYISTKSHYGSSRINWRPYADAIRCIPDVLFSPGATRNEISSQGLRIRFQIPRGTALDAAERIYKALASFEARILAHSLRIFPWINESDLLDIRLRIPLNPGETAEELATRTRRTLRRVLAYGTSHPGANVIGVERFECSLSRAS